jgi:hypothetical protein
MEERGNTKAEQTCGHERKADAAADGKRGHAVLKTPAAYVKTTARQEGQTSNSIQRWM